MNLHCNNSGRDHSRHSVGKMEKKANKEDIFITFSVTSCKVAQNYPQEKKIGLLEKCNIFNIQLLKLIKYNYCPHLFLLNQNNLPTHSFPDKLILNEQFMI